MGRVWRVNLGKVSRGKTAVLLDFVQITSPLSSSRMKIEYMMMQVKCAQTMMVRWAVYLAGILFAQPDLPN